MKIKKGRAGEARAFTINRNGMLKGENAALPDTLASSLRRMHWIIGRGVLVWLLMIISFGHSSDSLNWFPYKTGDMWEYWFYDGITLDTAQIINIRDSVSADGKIHLTQIRQFINPIDHDPYLDSLHYTIDTTAGEVYGTPPAFEELYNVLVYKFDVQSGDMWVMYDNNAPPGGYRYEMARVKWVYDGVLLGSNATFIEMNYYGAADSADTSGLDRYGAILAEGFGLVGIFIAEGGWTYNLKGAVINGVLYGDTTQVLATADDVSGRFIPQTVKLHQNYPNPFNSKTVVKYYLPTTMVIRLGLYDTAGRLVRVLVHEEQPMRAHTVVIDGSGLAAGVYLYQIVGDGFRNTKKLVFLK